MALSPIIDKFNGGEYSPKVDCRDDLEKYYSGCRTMENMYAEPYGNASNQPGTYFVNEVKDSNDTTILIPFKHSIGQSYQLEFGDLYIRFYKDRGQIVYTTLTIDAQPAGGDWAAGDVLTGGTSGVTCEVVAVVSSTVYTVKHVTGTWTDGEVITADDANARDCGAGYPTVAASTTPCEVVSPYASADLYGLQYKQSADVMIITHIDHEYPVYKLSRTAHDDWTIETVDFEYGPFLPENTTATTINSTNTQTYDRTLDNAAAVDLGGAPNEVRIPSTAHGFLEGDYVIVAGTTNYNGTFEITNINDVDTFDIESAFSAETFTGTETAKSRITLTASTSIFTSGHVGSIWQLIYHMENEYVEADWNLDAPANDEYSDSIRMENGKFTTGGGWAGKIQLQRSYDEGDTWHPYHTYAHGATAEANYITVIAEEEVDVLYRARKIYRLADFGACSICLSVEDSGVKGIVEITDYASATVVRATVTRALAEGSEGDETAKWSEGAWSDERGYPGTVDFFEERTVFGGSTYKPHTSWMSKKKDWYNMRAGTLSDNAITKDLPTSEMIKWLASHEVLLIGTKADEWRLGSSDPAKPLTPDEPSAPRRQTGYGSGDLQAILIGNVVIFVQRMKKKVWGLKYNFTSGESGGYDAQDLTILAEHITGSGIIQMTYQNQPESVLWSLTSDGYIAGMSFQPKELVVGWHRHTTDGTYESVSCIPIASGEDELWVIVNRTIGGVTKRYIEYFMPRDWGTDQKDCFFVHSGLSFDGGDAVDITGISVGADPFKVTVTAVAHGRSNGDQVKIVSVGGTTDVNNKVYTVSDKADDTFILKDKTNSVYITGEDYGTYTSGGTVQKVDNVFAGLGHLKGETVAVLADGAVHEQVVVSASGTITLDVFANKVHAGLPYTAKLKPMRIAFPTGKGSTRGDYKRIHEIFFSFYKTLGAKFGTTEGSEEINFRKVSDTMGEAIPLFTGIKRQTFGGGYELDGDIYIEQDQPLPMTIRAIIPKLKIYDE